MMTRKSLLLLAISLLGLLALILGCAWFVSVREYEIPVTISVQDRMRVEGQIVELEKKIAQQEKEKKDVYPSYLDLGQLYEALGKGRAAMRAYESAAHAKPEIITPYLSLGNVSKHAKRYRHAALYYEKALAVDPVSLEAYLELIHLTRDHLGAPPSEVQALYERAASKVGNLTELHRDFARFLETLGTQESRQQAIDHWKEVQNSLPKDVEAHKSLERLGGS